MPHAQTLNRPLITHRNFTEKELVNLRDLQKSIQDIEKHILRLESYLIQNIGVKADLELKNLPVATKDGYVFIPIHDIVRCRADGNYTFIFTRKGGRYLQSQTLKDIEAYLPKGCFIRTHQSHLANIDCIVEYKRNGQHILVMEDQSVIPISRNRRIPFLRKMNLMD